MTIRQSFLNESYARMIPYSVNTVHVIYYVSKSSLLGCTKYELFLAKNKTVQAVQSIVATTNDNDINEKTENVILKIFNKEKKLAEDRRRLHEATTEMFKGIALAV